MDDRLFYPMLALIVAGMIALSLVWPQGLGGRSPPPFGHPIDPAASHPGPAAAPPTAEDR